LWQHWTKHVRPWLHVPVACLSLTLKLFRQDERVRLPQQLAAVKAELRQATEANRQHLTNPVCLHVPGFVPSALP
jgi:hypothetical protein